MIDQNTIINMTISIINKINNPNVHIWLISLVYNKSTNFYCTKFNFPLVKSNY